MKTQLFEHLTVTRRARHTDIGTIGKQKIVALTDVTGSAVVVKGPRTHLLSKAFPNHDIAVQFGKEVLSRGRTDFYKRWTNFHTATGNEKFYAMFLNF